MMHTKWLSAAAVLSALVFAGLLLMKTFRKSSHADETRHWTSSWSLAAWAILAVAFVVAAVLTKPVSKGLSANVLLDDARCLATDAYYATKAYKMKIF